ncbi:isochorismatase family protein [Chitinophagaceae bacterium MMS25-I14]
MVTTLDRNTALVLIDLQNGIVQFPVAHPVSGIIENAAKLAAAFRTADLPVVLVNVNPSNAPAMTTRRESGPAGKMEIKEEWLEIVPELEASPSDIYITKQTWNAFFETSLHEELQKRNITGIVLAGISTSIGVEGTARSANERGYNIAFVQDAMTDMFADAHAHSLKYIFPRIGEVGDTVRILELVEKI